MKQGNTKEPQTASSEIPVLQQKKLRDLVRVILISSTNVVELKYTMVGQRSQGLDSSAFPK